MEYYNYTEFTGANRCNGCCRLSCQCPPRPRVCCCAVAQASICPPIGPHCPRGATGPQGPMGPTGPQGPTGPYLSAYVEAIGSTQNVASRSNIAFDVGTDDVEIVGTGISLDASGTVFSITRPGLYHVEWSVNLQTGTEPIILSLLENGEAISGLSNIVVTGNYSSGALINVKDADATRPYTVSLHNYGGAVTLMNHENLDGSAVSIRILRFADGPSI